MNHAYGLALASSVAFAFASLVFTHYARKVSVMWVNCFKASVALVAFGAAIVVSGVSHSPNVHSIWLFLLSGFVGLNIGDIFLVKAFKAIGPARTLVIFSFQPVILGVFAFLIFGQTLTIPKCIGILFMIACVFTLSYERFKKESRWEVKGPLFALLGVLLDSCGVLLTRSAFEIDPDISALEGNFFRCIGAVLGFALMYKFMRIKLLDTFFKLPAQSRAIVLFGGVMGTFVSLWLYLTAISIGSLATISAIIGTGPVFAAIFEAIIQKKWPSAYLYIAFTLCGFGFLLLL